MKYQREFKIKLLLLTIAFLINKPGYSQQSIFVEYQCSRDAPIPTITILSDSSSYFSECENRHTRKVDYGNIDHNFFFCKADFSTIDSLIRKNFNKLYQDTSTYNGWGCFNIKMKNKNDTTNFFLINKKYSFNFFENLKFDLKSIGDKKFETLLKAIDELEGVTVR